jgi:hypothetical protein
MPGFRVEGGKRTRSREVKRTFSFVIRSDGPEHERECDIRDDPESRIGVQ